MGSNLKVYNSASSIFKNILKAEDSYCRYGGPYHTSRTRPLPSRYTLPIPTNRTQNPEEALEGSLLLFITMNKTSFHPWTHGCTSRRLSAEAWSRSVKCSTQNQEN